MTASRRWAEALAAWASPEEIRAAAPAPPWGFPTEFFANSARRALAEPPTPTHQEIISAMPTGGVLLDVGSGAGAASLPAAPPAGRIVAVDEDHQMLEALSELAAGRAAGHAGGRPVAGGGQSLRSRDPLLAGTRHPLLVADIFCPH